MYDETNPEIRNRIHISVSLPHEVGSWLKRSVDPSKRSQYIARLIEESRYNRINKPAMELLNDSIKEELAQKVAEYRKQKEFETKNRLETLKKEIDAEEEKKISELREQYKAEMEQRALSKALPESTAKEDEAFDDEDELNDDFEDD